MPQERVREPADRPPGRRRWSPGPVLRGALIGGVLGSACGLAFGLVALNRPLLNALVFYVLGFAAGALGGGLLALAGPRPAGGDRTGPARPDRGGTPRTGDRA